MQAFLTGSHAYGAPKDDSDVDLVIFVDDKRTHRLLEVHNDLFDVEKDDADQAIYHTPSESLKYGKLNLIICKTEKDYNEWKTGTEMLVKERASTGQPVSRERAIEVLDVVFGRHKTISKAAE